jgi:hypothetical protein
VHAVKPSALDGQESAQFERRRHPIEMLQKLSRLARRKSAGPAPRHMEADAHADQGQFNQ